MDSLSLAASVVSFLRPLLRAVEDPQQESYLLAQLGYAAPPGVSFLGGLKAPVNAILAGSDALAQTTSATDESAIASSLKDIVDAVSTLFQIASDLKSSLSASAQSSPLVTKTDFLATLLRKLADFLVVDFLSREFDGFLCALRVMGLVEINPT